MNTQGVIGHCFPKDLRNEHLNKVGKEHITDWMKMWSGCQIRLARGSDSINGI